VSAAALALLVAAGPALHVDVDVLARLAPRTLVVRGAGIVRSIAARGGEVLVDGRPAPALRLAAGSWSVEVPGAPARAYEGALAFRARDGVLAIRATLDLERYVAGVVASEALPGTPGAALEALAVAVRSYALASRDRHPGGGLCDLAHCQLLRAEGIAASHRAAAARAARATAGEVLVLGSGEIAAAAFHASCGGHTADAREVFGSDRSGGRATADPGCEGAEWRAEVEPAALAIAVRRALGSDPRAAAIPAELRARDLALARGAGGFVVRVEGADGSWRLSGDAFARALDAAVGRGKVRSARLTMEDRGDRVVVRGSGHGHGVGLCLAGAARRAAQGDGRQEILGRYYRARVATVELLGARLGRIPGEEPGSRNPGAIRPPTLLGPTEATYWISGLLF
jgi:stage II sporulation protein D